MNLKSITAKIAAIRAAVPRYKKSLAAFGGLLVTATTLGVVPTAWLPYTAGVLVILGTLGVIKTPANALSDAQKSVVVSETLGKVADVMREARAELGDPGTVDGMSAGALPSAFAAAPLVTGTATQAWSPPSTFTNIGEQGPVVMQKVPDTVAKPAKAAARRIAGKATPTKKAPTPPAAKKITPGVAKKPAPRKRT